jgi:hypothetical protein
LLVYGGQQILVVDSDTLKSQALLLGYLDTHAPLQANEIRTSCCCTQTLRWYSMQLATTRKQGTRTALAALLVISSLAWRCSRDGPFFTACSIATLTFGDARSHLIAARSRRVGMLSTADSMCSTVRFRPGLRQTPQRRSIDVATESPLHAMLRSLYITRYPAIYPVASGCLPRPSRRVDLQPSTTWHSRRLRSTMRCRLREAVRQHVLCRRYWQLRWKDLLGHQHSYIV